MMTEKMNKWIETTFISLNFSKLLNNYRNLYVITVSDLEDLVLLTKISNIKFIYQFPIPSFSPIFSIHPCIINHAYLIQVQIQYS